MDVDNDDVFELEYSDSDIIGVILEQMNQNSTNEVHLDDTEDIETFSTKLAKVICNVDNSLTNRLLDNQVRSKIYAQLDRKSDNSHTIEKIWKKAKLLKLDKISPRHERTIRRTLKHRPNIKAQQAYRHRANSRTKTQRNKKRSSQISHRRAIFAD